MSNPNKHNFQPEFDPLDQIDEELYKKSQIDLAKNALFDDEMTTKERQEVVASFREYRDQRPEPSMYQTEVDADSHAETLKKMSTEELALAAREAEEGQLYEVSEEIMRMIEDRILSDEKYAILDPENMITRDHPSYGDYLKAQREYAMELSQYLQIADPENSLEVEDNTGSTALSEIEANESTADAEVESDDVEIDEEGEKERLSRSIFGRLDKIIEDKVLNPEESDSSPEDDSSDSDIESGSQEDSPEADADSSKEGNSELKAGIENALINSKVLESLIDQNTEEMPKAEPESKSEINSKEVKSDEQEESEENDVTLEVLTAKDYKYLRKTIKQHYRTQMKYAPSRELKRQYRAEKIKALRELNGMTDFSSAGLRAKVFEVVDNQDTRVSRFKNIKSEMYEKLRERKQEFRKEDEALRAKLVNTKDATAQQELIDQIDDLKSKYDEDKKRIKSNHKSKNYDDFRADNTPGETQENQSEKES